MLKISSTIVWGEKLFIGGIGMTAVGLCTSPVLMSIGVGAVGLSGLIQFETKKSLKQPWIWPLLFMVWLLASVLYTDDLQGWLSDIRIKLPLILVPLGFCFNKPLNIKSYRLVAILFTLGVILVGFLTLFDYLRHQAFYDQQILQSKAINPVTFFKLSHIYFNLMAGFGIGLSVYLAASWPLLAWERTWFRWIWVCGGIGLVIYLHVVGGRTGLIALYTGLGVAGLYLVKRFWKWSLMGLILLPLIMGGLYWASSGLQNRVTNTLKDLEAYRTKTGIGDYSLARRLVVWQACTEIFFSNPVMGVGAADLQHDLIRLQPIIEPSLTQTQLLKDAHNQYLETSAGLGIVGLTLLLLWLVVPVVKERFSAPLTVFVSMVAVAMIFESLLERQVGVTFIVLGWCLITSFTRQKSSPN